MVMDDVTEQGQLFSAVQALSEKVNGSSGDCSLLDTWEM